MDATLIPWSALSPWAALLGVVGLIVGGMLVPLRTVRRNEVLLQKLADERGKAADGWQSAHDKLLTAHKEQADQLSLVLESSRTTVELLRALRVGAS